MRPSDRRRTTLLARAALMGLALSLAAGACGDAKAPPAGAPAEPGAEVEQAAPALEPAPAFDLPRLGGGHVDSGDLAGKIVVIDFWATWCPPCEFQVPELNAFWDDHRDETDLVLYGASVDTAGADVVADWVAEKDVRYPVLLEGEPLARRVGALGFPTLIIVTPDGLIDEVHTGLIERTTLEDAVARLRREARAAAEPEAPTVPPAPASAPTPAPTPAAG